MENELTISLIGGLSAQVVEHPHENEEQLGEHRPHPDQVAEGEQIGPVGAVDGDGAHDGVCDHDQAGPNGSKAESLRPAIGLSIETSRYK